jgi:mono/diheme cytochrome c family protein
MSRNNDSRNSGSRVSPRVLEPMKQDDDVSKNVHGGKKAMSRSASIVGIAVFALIFAAVVSRNVVLAQRGGAPGGAATPQKVNADGTVPVKVSTRVYDKKALLSAPVLSEEVETGRALWLQKCAYCHDGVGQPTYKTVGTWIGAETVTTLGEDVVRVFISNGTPRMPGFSYALDEKQMNALIAYLKTVPSDQKPTPGQLAGTSGAPGSND